MAWPSKYALLLLAALAVVLWTARPIATPLIIAAAVAGALKPLHERLARRFGGRPRLAAVTMTTVVALAILAALLGVGAVVVRHIGDAIEMMRTSLLNLTRGGLASVADSLPSSMGRTAAWLRNLAPSSDTVRDLLASQAGTAAETATRAVQVTGQL